MNPDLIRKLALETEDLIARAELCAASVPLRDLGEDCQTLAAGMRVGFGKGQAGERFARRGWHAPEAEFRWSNAPKARIEFQIDADADYVLTLEARSFASPQRLELRMLDLPLGVYWLGDRCSLDFIVTRQHVIAGGGMARIDVCASSLQRPSYLSHSTDQRLLGIAVYSLLLVRPENFVQ